jgi:formylglycine-generating enzyme required for sulfatase activity
MVEEAPAMVEEAPSIVEEAPQAKLEPKARRQLPLNRWLGATVMVALIALLGWFAVDYLSYDVGSTFVSQKDSMTLVYVPEGEFLMGALPADGEAEANEKPQRLVSLDAYWIDQTEVTNAMFARFVEETGHQTDAERDNWAYVYLDETWTQMDGATWRHPNAPDSNLDGLESYPVVQMSWHDANAYCKWAERRLPTEAEWEKAVRGSLTEEASRKYAWGNELPTNASQLDGIHKVASYANGISPYQAFDMSSNAWEWTADWHNEQYHQNTASHNPKGTGGEEHTYRGGGFDNETSLIRATIRQRANPIFRVNLLGFRCAQSP